MMPIIWEPKRLNDSYLSFGVQVEFSVLPSVSVIPEMMQCAQTIAQVLGLDVSMGESINAEWALVNKGRGKCKHGIKCKHGMNIRVRVCPETLPGDVEDMKASLYTSTQTFLRRIGLEDSDYKINEPETGTVNDLPESQITLIQKKKVSAVAERGQDRPLSVPAWFYPYQQDPVEWQTEWIWGEICQNINAGISVRFTPVEFSAKEIRSMETAAESPYVLTACRDAYRQYRSMDTPFVFTVMLWGSDRFVSEITAGLSKAGLPLETKRISLENAGERLKIHNEICFDPWAFLNRQYGHGELKRMCFLTDVQEVTNVCGKKAAEMAAVATEQTPVTETASAQQAIHRLVQYDPVMHQLAIMEQNLVAAVQTSGERNKQDIITAVHTSGDQINEKLDVITSKLDDRLSNIRELLENGAGEAQGFQQLHDLVSELQKADSALVWTEQDWKEFGIDYDLKGMEGEEKDRLQNCLMILKQYKILRARSSTQEAMKKQLINYATPLLCQYEVLAKGVLRDIYEAALKEAGISITNRMDFNIDRQDFSFFTRYAIKADDPLYEKYPKRESFTKRGYVYAALLFPASKKANIYSTRITIWLNIFSSLRSIRNKVHGTITEEDFQCFCDGWMRNGCEYKEKHLPNDQQWMKEKVDNDRLHFYQSALQFLLSCRERLKDIKENMENNSRAQQTASV